MKHPQEERERWLRQAAHDLEVARRHLRERFFSDACFAAEQTAQKALKGYLYGRGERVVTEHSIAVLLGRAVEYHDAFRTLREAASVLDQYYVATRYPDALARPAVPFESYHREEAAKAVDIAEKIFSLVQSAL